MDFFAVFLHYCAPVPAARPCPQIIADDMQIDLFVKIALIRLESARFLAVVNPLRRIRT